MPHQPEMAESADARRQLDELFSIIYEELRRLASYARKKEAHSTLSSTALVHEAWLKLKGSPLLASKAESHFKSIAANAMREVLVDRARRRNALKRKAAAEAIAVNAADFSSKAISCDAEFLDLDSALQELEQTDPRQAQIVKLRFFGGLSTTEAAEILGISDSSVERDWRSAKAWLAAKMRPALQ